MHVYMDMCVCIYILLSLALCSVTWKHVNPLKTDF